MDRIKTEFDEDLGFFIVTLPELVTMEALREWKQAFLQALNNQPGPVGLLFDSHKHNFESIECLKWLKAFFTEEAIVGLRISRVAFVQPEQYRPAGAVSDLEAYFDNVQDARSWLRQAQ
jgi:hypothetical protein